jgi:hypothetical protein
MAWGATLWLPARAAGGPGARARSPEYQFEGAALYTAAFGPEGPATDFYAAPALSVIGNVLGFFEDEIEFVT